jgi:2-polyprenyl-6-methoxyphenol hydroxylase-like FAD-dependent oxidoreductase
MAVILSSIRLTNAIRDWMAWRRGATIRKSDNGDLVNSPREAFMGRTHAIVIGGSFAGLAAGRVLSEFYDRVTVLDRDTFPDGVADRAGVPQARHVHGLLLRGLHEYERFFPGFEALAIERGATFHDHTYDFAVLRPQGWTPRYRSGLKFLSASRELIESCVRDLFRRLPNVALRERAPVIGLDIDKAGPPRCRGVVVPRGSLATGELNSNAEDNRETLDADLVVDASGAMSRAPQWLAAAELRPPEETIVDPLAGYSSRWFQGPPFERWPQEWWWWAGAYIRRRPDDLVEANFQLKEHNRWHLTLSGFNRRYPPTDETGFTAFVERLRSPVIAEMIRLMEPISPVYANRAIRNRRRHYESWSERLDGFIAIGDAFCAYNPVYAQGMTAAAMSATMLRGCLERFGPADGALAREFHRAEAEIQHGPWMLSAGVDLRFPFTAGDRPLSLKLFNQYLDRVGAAASDPVVRTRLLEVAQLVRPFDDLFEPSIMVRVGARALAQAAASLSQVFSSNGAREIPPMPPPPMAGESRSAPAAA